MHDMTIEEEIKQEKFSSQHHKAVVNLIYTAHWLTSRQQDFFKPHNITGQQFNILRILKGQHPKTISATEIKSRMLDKNSDVSRLLDRLLNKNLIARKACPNDRRAADVTITKEGIDLLKAIAKQQENVEKSLLLNEAEAKQLSDLLDKSRGS
jgi:DNA-binding MarR family transcriptional regulator